MRKNSIFKLFIIILGVMMCFSFGKVQASEITSIFGTTLTRTNLRTVMELNTLSNNDEVVPITLGIEKSKYKTNNGNFYWAIKDSDGTYKDIYCLNLSRGFGAPYGNITNTNNTKEYNNQYDLNNISNTEYETLSGLNSENKNKILWILNNSLTSSDSLEVILTLASEKANGETVGLPGITSFVKEDMKNNEDTRTSLAFDDIKMVQQIAIWHYTNPGSIFDNTINGICDSNGNQISSQGENILVNTETYYNYVRSGLIKQAKLNALYQYFIDGAESGKYETVIPTLSLANTNVEVIESGSDYIVGPFSLTGENIAAIKELTANVSKNYTLLDSSKEQVNNNDFSKVINSNFYLKIAKNVITENTEIGLGLTYKYDVRELTFLTNTENEEYKNTQPVVIVKSEEKTKTINTTANIELTEIIVEKVWNDNQDQDGVRPDEVKVQLYKDNSAYGNSITLSDSNNWTYTWTKLLDGHTYIVKELNANGNAVENNGKYNNYYTAKYEISGNKTTITNTHIPGVVEKTVTKVWEDGNDSDEIRPTSIEVQLYKTIDKVKTSMGNKYKVTLDKANSWTYTWTNLPEKENGKQIIYTAEEVEVPEGYTVTYSEDTFTITNIHVSQGLEIQLQKVDEEGNIITSSEAIFAITGAQEVTAQTSKGILDLKSQKLLNNNFEFIYTIKETDAPIGYDGILEDLTLKISGTAKLEDGRYIIETVNITDKDGNELDSTKISAEYDKTLNKVVIKVVNTRKTNEYSVKLLKVSEDEITPISGAMFKVNDGQAILVSETGEEIATGTLSESGELNLTYKLEETVAPDGYIKIEEPKEVKINAKVEFKDNEYQLTDVKLVEVLDGIIISEENNVITIKVKNEVEITGKYNVVLRKVDENGNILLGSRFEINGTEYELPTGEVTIVENADITSDEDIDFTYLIKETEIPEGYNGIEEAVISLKAKVQKEGSSYKLIRVILVDSEGNSVTDENISVKIEGDAIVIVVKNTPIEKKFDLALRKFITKVNEIEYFRSPVVDTSTIATSGTATYKHTKQPIPVQKGDVVTYTIRVYNEGEIDGYVDKITDYLPDNLLPIIDGIEGIHSEKYKDEIDFNSNWLWIYSEDGKVITTTITSKLNTETYSILTGLQEVTDTKLDAYVEGANKLDYIDVQIKCLVTDASVSNEYLTNIAEITESQDINGIQGNGMDSELGNVDHRNLSDYKNNESINSTENSYVKGQEDDDDFEKLVVKEFDLALRKFITRVNETAYSRVPVVDTSKLGTVVNGKTITTATYSHSKEPVIVETGDLVTYTIRIYNEGTLAGFANEITDNIPEGLEFLLDSSVNVSYRWKMLDIDGNETEDVSKAVMIVTDYLSDIDKNNSISEISEENGVKVLSYKDVEVQFKVIAKAENLQDNIIINEAQISSDSDRDIDSNPNRDEKYDYTSGNNEDDIDYEPIKLQYFDLALRKFITKVNSTEYNNRYPEIKYNEDGSITYNHTKDPVLVTTNDIVVYTIRIYNEGEKAGYATEITDNLPDGLEFIPENEINKQYRWKLLDSQGNVTEEIEKAVKASTEYLKDELISALVEENGQKILSYKDVQIAFKVVEPNTSDRILVNIAEISNDSDDDIDSIPGNNVLTEDDIDREYVRVQYFDLALKKWVTRTEVTYNGKTTTTKTGFTEGTDEIAKVDLVASKMNKTTVKFAYNIKVTNEGELPGYAYEVKDYIPNGLKFVAEDNKDWKELEDGTVVTDKLKDTLLNPGESAIVEIVLTWKNSTTNLGLKTNYAEISNDSADDIDSVPDNNDLEEDDIDDAQVILSIKTAGAKTYIGLIFATVAILAGGIFLIKKYVI